MTRPEKKITLIEAVSGEETEVTEEDIADLLGINKDEPDYDDIARFFGFK